MIWPGKCFEREVMWRKDAKEGKCETDRKERNTGRSLGVEEVVKKREIDRHSQSLI